MAKNIIVGTSPKKRMKYDDAVMYCMFLEEQGIIGWRIPTKGERCLKLNTYHDKLGDTFWYAGCDDKWPRYVLPVRTVE